jgi:hypothetical protein
VTSKSFPYTFIHDGPFCRQYIDINFIFKRRSFFMSGVVTMMSIVKAEGEVMIHDGRSGWMRAVAGMVFPAKAKLTIKTGSDGRGEIINARGEHVRLEPSSMLVVCACGTADDVDTLSRITLNGADVRIARILFRRRLVPLRNS